ncbi:unnamed protein product, partial [Ectocarpus sp. 12 AP-2014]
MIPNNIMAKKAIRNQWRSSPFLHYTKIAISATTPMETLDQMKAGIAAGMRVTTKYVPKMHHFYFSVDNRSPCRPVGYLATSSSAKSTLSYTHEEPQAPTCPHLPA